jgi:hypothetical protein
MESNIGTKSKDSSSKILYASCHCGALRQHIRFADSIPGLPVGTALCHCYTCRHSTGLLCTSYMPISNPESLSNTTTHPSNSDQIQRHFCSTCGCHMFRSRPSNGQDQGSNVEQEKYWEVATGVLNNVASFVHIDRHINVSDTKDGGLSIWIKEQNGNPLPVFEGPGPDNNHSNHTNPPTLPTTSNSPSPSPSLPLDAQTLPATCLCENITFYITRPNAASSLPHSNFPDLMIPYHTASPLIPNLEDEKWWLRANNTKFLAGTCACRSCRLMAGFEVQCWGFVPRVDICFWVRRECGVDGGEGGVGDGDR